MERMKKTQQVKGTRWNKQGTLTGSRKGKDFFEYLKMPFGARRFKFDCIPHSFGQCGSGTPDGRIHIILFLSLYIRCI